MRKTASLSVLCQHNNKTIILFAAFRMISEDTIETRIKGLQEFKLAISEQVMTGSKNKAASKLNLDDMKKLFDM